MYINIPSDNVVSAIGLSFGFCLAGILAIGLLFAGFGQTTKRFTLFIESGILVILTIVGVGSVIYTKGTSVPSQQTDQISKPSQEINKIVQIQQTDSRDTNVATHTANISYIKKSNDKNIQTSVRYDSDHTKITYQQDPKTKITFDGAYTNLDHIFRGEITVYSPDLKP